ncbi:uncharacterized protein MICPUCDRAFT_35551 [Micromonas pusilla CCMP1545]|uniref:Predicted protein n=1 Tax=Micromonas pusilla (strain CCMP1545) TaxID=564608 RepID=C1N1P4_MICPC|nr:uncharacterized protein MICPUCDRAFT_35551 [Micromonas pusilla CCMP1545]EEH53662.1 predicted protein [Micromonas pusilla CCMP1545]|eukprot:XP_003061950.1 predicted protein [Micromonas pusilla CCMP1545]
MWGWDGPDDEDLAFDVDAFDVDQVAETRRVERMVLTDLYRTTEGSRWYRQRGWLSRETHCAWEGVTCLRRSDPFGVLSLELRDNGLAGPLPQTLARLHKLRNLDLRDNALRGSVSSAFGSMTKLKVLLLKGNAVNGKLPKELGGAAGLTQADLSANAFIGAMPADLGRLSNLRMLNVSHNGLSGELPHRLCGAPSLEVLSASKNRIRGGLERCGAALDARGAASTMRLFDASENNFDGEPPAAPSRSGSLAIWDVSGNALTGTIPNRAPPRSLRVLSYARNKLTGAIPDALFPRDSGLRRVDLSGNALNGTLPDGLMGLTKVRVVNVSGNALSGAIPSEGDVDVRAMASLTDFDASNNALVGAVPPSLAGLKHLRTLSLRGNKLTGTIPCDQLAHSRSLRELDLSDNDLSGELSGDVAALGERLTRLDLSRNRLSGPVPVGLITGRALTHLDISGNEDLDWTSLGVREGA